MVIQPAPVELTLYNLIIYFTYLISMCHGVTFVKLLVFSLLEKTDLVKSCIDAGVTNEILLTPAWRIHL